MNKSENILSHEEWLKLLSEKNTNIYTIRREKLLFSLISGIPITLRRRIWKFLSNIRYVSMNHDKNFFNSLLEIKNKDIETQIKKDIERTFLLENCRSGQNDKLINSNSSEIKEKLYNVLKAYAIYDPQVGYSQGTNFIVMVLLSNISSARETFWTFVQIMHDKNWRLMFIHNTPKLMKAFDKLLESIKNQINDLHAHFEKENVK
jgi:hypothetical protein